ncbi:MAG: glycosyltransferase family 2 protein [Planctomycetales bacterium]|nr:glycosyltransferase family 2 protein [Planctomycetales bacterium]
MGMKTLIVAAFLLSSVTAWTQCDQFEQAVDFLRNQPYGLIYLRLGQTLLVINLAAFLWRVFLFFRYRPVEGSPDAQLPVCTVVVPAYNEGSMVLKTLESILQSDYPADKLQIIAVDDGSVDDTWAWMEKAAAGSHGRIEAVRMAKNGGKRRALYEGFIRSKADVLVTIDSDSLIDPETIRCLVSPFADAAVGGVAGNVVVLNQDRDIIPRMLDVSFAYSFEFIRASQSAVNTVFCTPGALSAYRREVVMQVLDAWLNQTFLGQPAGIGEDRAMTNAILQKGYHVTFQSNAVVYTTVPVRYKGLCKMFLRWARSNVREMLAMSSFIFTRFRRTPATGARANFLLSAIQMIVPQILLVGLTGCFFWHPALFLSHALFGACVAGSVPAAFYAWRRNFSSEALWAILYSMFWIFGLSWIAPYALVTAGNNKWLTREADKRTRRMRWGRLALYYLKRAAFFPAAQTSVKNT